MKTKSILQLFAALLCCFSVVSQVRAETASYAYDEAGRLIGVYYSGGKSITYLYDGNGNLLREIRVSVIDSDSDGMDDSWETTKFGNLSRNGLADFDNDGQSDLHEFMAGTDPKDAQSVLAITQVTSAPGVSFTIQWAAVSGKYYRVQYNDSLLPSDWKNLGGDVLANTSTVSKVDNTAPQGTKRFYRVIALF